MRETRFKIAQEDITAALDAEESRVFTHRELSHLLSQNRGFWRLPEDMSAKEFIKLLTSRTQMEEVVFRAEGRRSIKRYVWGDVSDYEVACTLRTGAYLSHSTALFLHALTDQIPKTIYVNKEQSPKPQASGDLEQSRIDVAFSRPARESQLVYELRESRVRVLSGKHTGRLEVGSVPDPKGHPVDATKIERTLIDCAVRPNYAGGPYVVRQAFEEARGRMSVGVLVATLKKLGHAYPYQQVIGFYMDRAGYSEAETNRLRELGLDYDFYLTHGLEETEFVPEWRLHVPRGF